MEVSGQLHGLAALPPEKEPQVIVYEPTGHSAALTAVEYRQNFLSLPEIKTPADQPVARRYTD
jgi:hypothetical protein